VLLVSYFFDFFSKRYILLGSRHVELVSISSDKPPQWKGFSQILTDIFKAGRIDPIVTYARFYSDMKRH
jgi:hypothetical protein